MRIDTSIELFMEDKALQGLAPSSIEEYGIQLHIWMKWLYSKGIFNTSAVSIDNVRSFLSFRHKTSSQSSLCHQRTILRNWFGWLFDNNHISFDPRMLPHVSKPKPDQIRRVRLSVEQTAKLFDALKCKYRNNRYCKKRGFRYLQDLVVAALLFGGGLRISEVLNVCLHDLNIPTRELYISHAKNHNPRYIVLSGVAIGIIRLYLKVRIKLDIKSDVLLVSLESKAYTPKTVARRLQRLAKSVGIEFTTHAGRRFNITGIARYNVFLAQQQAGHKNLSTTRLYVPDDIEKLHDVVREHDPLRM